MASVAESGPWMSCVPRERSGGQWYGCPRRILASRPALLDEELVDAAQQAYREIAWFDAQAMSKFAACYFTV